MKLINYILFFVLLSSIAESKSYSAENIKASVIGFIQNEFGEDCIVEIESKLKDLTFDSENVVAGIDKEFFKTNNYKMIKVKFLTDNFSESHINIPVKILKKKEVLKAKNNISPGTKISPNHFYSDFDYVEINNDNYQLEFSDNSIANSYIKKDEVCSFDKISPDFEIAKGDDINIVANTGSIIVRTKGVALENGRVGQKIKVQREGAKKILHGIIGEDGNLIVESK